ncbi:MAG: tetratricopeptide repeat protein [bacterium]|nr:MAG: tetratricopeptide repeat protein [bacterium]
MNESRYNKNYHIPDRLIIFYLKLWKVYLSIRKFLIYMELKWKRIKAFYILKLYLNYPLSWRNRIAFLEYKKRYENVIQLCYQRMTKIVDQQSEELAEIHEIIGRNLRNLNRIDEALNSFLYARSNLKSTSPSLYYEIGLIHFIKRNYALARRSMEAAIKMGYDTALLRIHLGKVYYQMGMLTRAEDCFKRVLNVYPREGSLYFLLAIVYKSKAEYQLAINAFKNAIKYGSDQKEEHLGLAEIYTRLGHWNKAIQEYKRILEFEQNNFIAHYFLGWIYEIQGLEDEAIQQYLLANKIDPEDEDTKQKLTQLLASPVMEEFI